MKYILCKRRSMSRQEAEDQATAITCMQPVYWFRNLVSLKTNLFPMQHRSEKRTRLHDGFTIKMVLLLQNKAKRFNKNIKLFSC